MVICVSGGLGNQMFQYAFGYAYAKDNDEELIQDLFYASLNRNRKYGLDKYEVSYPKKSKIRGFVYHMGKKVFKKGIYLRRWKRINKVVVETSSLDYQDVGTKNCYAIGTWINPRYFDKYRDEIIAQFKYKYPTDEDLEKLIKTIATSESLAIHIRRGDYLKPENQAYRNIEKSYYLKAIDYMKKKTNVDGIYFFSDDIEWCKKEYEDVESAIFVDETISKSPYTDLELMRNCKYFVIANSTFSWWGAWLSTREGKQMVAPSKWFNGENNEIYNVRVRTMLLKNFTILDE